MARHGSKNLVDLSDRTKEEQHRIVTQGGYASGIVRKQKSLLKDTCIMVGKMELGLVDDKTVAEALKLNGLPATEENIMVINLASRAKTNHKDFVVYRDTIGEKPIERVAMAVLEDKMDSGEIMAKYFNFENEEDD